MAVFEQPPLSFQDDQKEYLSRVNTEVGNELENLDQLTRYTAIPEKVSTGKLYYFKNAVAAHPVITSEGYYGYKSTGWVLIA